MNSVKVNSVKVGVAQHDATATASEQALPSLNSERVSRHGLWLMGAMLVIITATILMFTSAWDDSPVWDEPEHLTGGYLYLTAQDYRINCFHPPLFKDLAALPLLFMPLKSPLDDPHCRKQIFFAPHRFFYSLGNDCQSMMRAARAPLMLSAAAFFFYFFFSIAQLYGRPTALFALVMLGFSPTILAHSRYVTNDVPAAAAFFICFIEYAKFLQNPGRRRLALIASLTAIAQLIKFSLIVLYPLYALFAVINAFMLYRGGRRALAGDLRAAAWQSAVVVFTGLVVVSSVYAWHMVHMPAGFQEAYNVGHFDSPGSSGIPAPILWTQQVPALRGLSWYMTGLLAQSHNLDTGNTLPLFFMGEFRSTAQPGFFPIMVLTKEPCGFLLLAVLGFVAWIMTQAKRILAQAGTTTTAANLVPIWGTLFVALYMSVAMRGGLTIGIRHLAPIFPFVYMLTAVFLVGYLAGRKPFEKKCLLSVMAVLTGWGAVSSTLSWPGYVSYYNELAGGKAGGASIALDSDFDWGGDLLRLRKYVDSRNIDAIHVMYHGKGSPKYYLGDHYRPLSEAQPPPSGEWRAASATFQRWGMSSAYSGGAASGSNVVPPPSRHFQEIKWCGEATPVANAGDSILIYRVP